MVRWLVAFMMNSIRFLLNKVFAFFLGSFLSSSTMDRWRAGGTELFGGGGDGVGNRIEWVKWMVQ